MFSVQVELNGFSVTPGSDVLVKLQPNLYTITESAKVKKSFLIKKITVIQHEKKS
jgi:hypothetical protein